MPTPCASSAAGHPAALGVRRRAHRRGAEPATVAAALVWETSWRRRSRSRSASPGGQLVASGRIPTQAILAAARQARMRQDGRSLTCLLDQDVEDRA